MSLNMQYKYRNRWYLWFLLPGRHIILVMSKTTTPRHSHLFAKLHGGSWWRHQMETFSALLALCHRSPVNSHHKGQWRGAFDVFFELRLNKHLNKQSWGWWFETLSHSSWRHCSVMRGERAVFLYQCIIHFGPYWSSSFRSIFTTQPIRILHESYLGPLW